MSCFSKRGSYTKKQRFHIEELKITWEKYWRSLSPQWILQWRKSVTRVGTIDFLPLQFLNELNSSRTYTTRSSLEIADKTHQENLQKTPVRTFWKNYKIWLIPVVQSNTIAGFSRSNFFEKHVSCTFNSPLVIFGRFSGAEQFTLLFFIVQVVCFVTILPEFFFRLI